MRGHPTSVWDEARHQVVVEGRSYVEVAEATGIGLSTLKARASADRWQEDRQALARRRVTAGDIKDRLLAQALGALEQGQALDPQQLFALARLEAVYPDHRYQKAAPPQESVQDLLMATQAEQEEQILTGAAAILRSHGAADLARQVEEKARSLQGVPRA